MDAYIIGAVLSILLLSIVIANILSARSMEKKLREKMTEQFGQIPDNDDLQFDSISRPWKYCTDKDSFCTVDDITWDDLDMNQVFTRIDACQTSLGEEYLYALLHKSDAEEASVREELMQSLESEPSLRLQLQIYLKKVGKNNYNGLIEFISSAEIYRLKHAWIYQIFTWLPAACLLLLPFNHAIAIACFICAVCLNILISYFVKRKIEQELTSVRYFSAVLWCCKKICSTHSECLAALRKNMNKSLSRLCGLSGAISSSIQNKFAMSDSEMILEYARMISLHEIRSYNKLIRIISADKDSCRSLCDELAKLDVSISILSFRKSLPFYSCPHFIQNIQLNLQGIYHPLLQNAVPNSVLFTGDSLITGSNASGKSTFIKAVAVNGILAMALNTCTARVFQGPKALVISSMAIRDNILAGDSYFVAEIKSLKRVLEHVKNKPCLCFIDEILKGTNTVERIAASTAVLRYLHQKNCLCLVASHDIELTQILKSDYDNYHFSEEITDQEIVFDYLIKQGPSKTTNAVKLLAYTGYEKEIIDEAESLVEKYEKAGVWESQN